MLLKVNFVLIVFFAFDYFRELFMFLKHKDIQYIYLSFIDMISILYLDFILLFVLR